MTAPPSDGHETPEARGLDYERFSARLIALLELDYPLPVNPYTGLYDEIGLDSLQAFQMLVIVETLAGADLPPPEIPEIYTMQDAFEYYASLLVSD